MSEDRLVQIGTDLKFQIPSSNPDSYRDEIPKMQGGRINLSAGELNRPLSEEGTFPSELLYIYTLSVQYPQTSFSDAIMQV